MVRRAGFPSSTTFVDQSNNGELDGYIQKSWEKFYRKLVSKYEDYFVAVFTNADIKSFPSAGPPGTAGIQAGVSDYSFPTDYLKMRRIECRLSSGVVWPLKRTSFDDELYLNAQSQQGQPMYYIEFGRGKLVSIASGEGAAGFRIIPTPDSTTAYSLTGLYVPTPGVISTGADGLAFSPDFFAGWDEYVVLDAAIKIRDKQESDISTLSEERADLLAIIETEIGNRSAGQPQEVPHHTGMLDEDTAEMLFD